MAVYGFEEVGIVDMSTPYEDCIFLGGWESYMTEEEYKRLLDTVKGKLND